VVVANPSPAGKPGTFSGSQKRHRIMSPLDLIKFVLGIIPTLLTLVTAVEEAFPAGGNGAQKLDFIKNSLAEIDAGAGQYWPSVSKIIALIVKLKNATGQFVTTGTADAGHNG
jgi:hypothetical protein